MGEQEVPVAFIGEVPEGTSHLVSIDGKEVALFHAEGHFYALGNRCPHRSGPLVKGRMETFDGTLAVRCPIHGWLFELSSGRCLTRPGASTPVYPVICTQEKICLGSPQGQTTGPAKPLSL